MKIEHPIKKIRPLEPISIENLQLIPFDGEGYNRDIHIIDFIEESDGTYNLVIKDLGRSDKTIKD